MTGTVSNPAKLSSIKSVFGGPSNFSAYIRGGTYVNAGVSSTIPTTAAGMKMSQFNNVADQWTTSWTTSYATAVPMSRSTSVVTSVTTSVVTSAAASRSTTTTWNSDYLACLEKGTRVLLPNGKEMAVEDLRVGMYVASLDLPGLLPETTAKEYRHYSTDTLEEVIPTRTKVNHISQDVSEFIMEFWMEGKAKPLRVTPSHPVFVKDVRNGQFRFISAENVSPQWHRFIDKDQQEVLIKDAIIYEGQFLIYKVDCAPFDVFFHQGILGHNMKPGGGVETYVVTSATTTTSWTSSWTTSWVTSWTTTWTTSWNSSRTTSNTTSAVTT
jgi:hypothetical protein